MHRSMWKLTPGVKSLASLPIVRVLLVATHCLRGVALAGDLIGTDESTLRTTHEGDVVGMRVTRAADTWQSIPYAQPPVGELRWRAPLPPLPWQGVRYGLGLAPPCSQFIGDPAAVATGGTVVRAIGQEDCLYLSIWSPHLEREEVVKLKEPLPVMVWIHGGGSEVGSGAVFNASVLAAEQKVIVVAVNYRLNLLGWFSHRAFRGEGTSADDRSGNFGTLDEIRALEWVRDNISAFGGDPRKVTIFGHSGGGWSIRALLASPRAEGLFHRAIIQSAAGAQLLPPAHAENLVTEPVPGHPLSSNELLLSLLIRDHCAGDAPGARTQLRGMSDESVARYLREKSYSELLQALEDTKVRNAGVVSREAQSAWITKSAPKFYDDGAVIDRHHGAQVPVMLGSTRYEDRLFLAGNSQYVSWEADAPRIRDRQRWELLSEYLGKFYKLRSVDDVAPQYQRDGAPVYAYRFDWDELVSPPGKEDFARVYGAAHGAEVAFVFGAPKLSWPPAPDDGEGYDESNERSFRELSKAMMSYWAQFARTGSPGGGRTGTLPAWNAWGAGQFMVFDAAARGGLRMSSERVTRERVLAQIKADVRLKEKHERCQFMADVRDHFLSDLTAKDYAVLGSSGCAAGSQVP